MGSLWTKKIVTQIFLGGGGGGGEKSMIKFIENEISNKNVIKKMWLFNSMAEF